MTAAAKSKKELPTVHLRDWRDRAVGFGWLVADVESLASILAQSKVEERIVDVDHSTILVLSLTEFELFGIDRDGRRTSSRVERKRYWPWKFKARPESRVERDDENYDVPWCPGHGFACSPTEPYRCGREHVIAVETCACRSVGNPRKPRGPSVRHEPSCEAVTLNASSSLAVATQRATAASPAATTLAAMAREPDAGAAAPIIHESSPPPPKSSAPRVKPSRANGWTLPGQLALGLPGPSKPR